MRSWGLKDRSLKELSDNFSRRSNSTQIGILSSCNLGSETLSHTLPTLHWRIRTFLSCISGFADLWFVSYAYNKPLMLLLIWSFLIHETWRRWCWWRFCFVDVVVEFEPIMTIPDSMCSMMENGSIEFPCTPEEERRIIQELTNKAEFNLKEGDLVYVISTR